MSTTAVIVQARRSSTRLPDKVLCRLAGETVLHHVLTRCLAIPGVDAVCCAVPDDPACEVLVAEAQRAGTVAMRGSELDVLDRYHRAADELAADIVMRVTSDCPLIDPEVCGQVLALYHESGADYVCNTDPPSWPHGLDCEVVSADWLHRSARLATLPSHREHVTQFVRAHRGTSCANLPCPESDLAWHRWTLDTPDDLAFLTEVFSRLPTGPKGWSWREALRVSQANPELAEINAGHDRWAGLKRSRAEDRRHVGHHQSRVARDLRTT